MAYIAKGGRVICFLLLAPLGVHGQEAKTADVFVDVSVVNESGSAEGITEASTTLAAVDRAKPAEAPPAPVAAKEAERTGLSRQAKPAEAVEVPMPPVLAQGAKSVEVTTKVNGTGVENASSDDGAEEEDGEEAKSVQDASAIQDMKLHELVVKAPETTRIAEEDAKNISVTEAAVAVVSANSGAAHTAAEGVKPTEFVVEAPVAQVGAEKGVKNVENMTAAPTEKAAPPAHVRESSEQAELSRNVAPVRSVTEAQSVSSSPVPPPTSFNCNEAIVDGWSDKKREYCCRIERIGCPSFPVSTTTRVDEEAKPAEVATKALAAEKTPEVQAVAAAGGAQAVEHSMETPFFKETPVAAVNKSSTSKEEDEERRRKKEEWRPRAGFDCREALDEMEDGWSDEKKAYCCTVARVGCPKSSSTEKQQQFWKMHDCVEATGRLRQTWSAGRSAWCCLRHNVACPKLCEDFRGTYVKNTGGVAVIGQSECRGRINSTHVQGSVLNLVMSGATVTRILPHKHSIQGQLQGSTLTWANGESLLRFDCLDLLDPKAAKRFNRLQRRYCSLHSPKSEEKAEFAYEPPQTPIWRSSMFVKFLFFFAIVSMGVMFVLGRCPVQLFGLRSGTRSPGAKPTFYESGSHRYVPPGSTFGRAYELVPTMES